MKNKPTLTREIAGVVMWGMIGWGVTSLVQWMFPGLAAGVVTAFFVGAFVMFVGLTILGGWRQGQQARERKAAMDQFIRDQKADGEKQAKIDQEIIEQLRNEHELSGTEQDRRLKALEAALKHLKRK